MRLKLRPTCSICLLSVGLLNLSSVADAATQAAPSPSFEVASVRLASPQTDPDTGAWSAPGTGRFTATHVSFARIVQLAYGIDSSQIANQPGWSDSTLYDIDAKPEAGIALTRDELKPRLQNLLRERFHLAVHTEMRSSSGYVLVVAKGGTHLVATKGDHFPGFRAAVYPGQMRGANWTMEQLAKYLTAPAGFPVVDQTGIAGSYDFAFSYNPKPDDTGSNLPSLDEALKEATGLMLKERKVTVETVVIDSANKVPTAN